MMKGISSGTVESARCLVESDRDFKQHRPLLTFGIGRFQPYSFHMGINAPCKTILLRLMSVMDVGASNLEVKFVGDYYGSIYETSILVTNFGYRHPSSLNINFEDFEYI